MRKVTAALLLSGMVAGAPAVVRADDKPTQILQSSAGGLSGADRMGGPTMTSPPHAWVGVGQSPDALSTDDTRKEKPRNPAVVGPPVPRQAKVLPSQETAAAPPKSNPPPSDQPTNDQPTNDQSTTDE
jgi:hypothetical protein